MPRAPYFLLYNLCKFIRVSIPLINAVIARIIKRFVVIP